LAVFVFGSLAKVCLATHFLWRAVSGETAGKVSFRVFSHIARARSFDVRKGFCALGGWVMQEVYGEIGTIIFVL
jgi:hypothetical protein